LNGLSPQSCKQLSPVPFYCGFHDPSARLCRCRRRQKHLLSALSPRASTKRVVGPQYSQQLQREISQK
jgi:hypothetical protein